MLADSECDPARADDVHHSKEDPPAQPNMLTANPMPGVC